MGNRINAFEIKGLRRILNLPPTHVDRSYTYETVIGIASILADKEIKPFYQSWPQAKFRLLGHMLRADDGSPLRQVVFELGAQVFRTNVLDSEQVDVNNHG